MVHIKDTSTNTELWVCHLGCWIMIFRNDYAGSSSGFFNLPWTRYQQGFGSPTALYSIGLDRLHQLTQGNCKVRFYLQYTDGTWHYAQYSTFSVGDSSTNYKLAIGGWSGDTGLDTKAQLNGLQFSTYDADHDTWSENCASTKGGGFWFSDCGWMLIMASVSSTTFSVLTSSGWMHLNVAEVRIVC